MAYKAHIFFPCFTNCTLVFFLPSYYACCTLIIEFYYAGSGSSNNRDHMTANSLMNSTSSHVNSRNLVTLSNSVNNSSNSYQNSISLQERIKDVAQSTVISAVSGSSSPFSLTAGSTSQAHKVRTFFASTSLNLEM